MSTPDTKATPQRAKTEPRYDELRDNAGAIRPHWKHLAEGLSALAPQEFTRRRAAAQDIIRDNGVTYNVYDEAEGQARPWQLDIVPFVIGPEDWRVIESGIIQRARLANTVLKDLYGSQKLIADGHLPPHVVLGHPQFLRPLVGVTPPHGVHVHLYSADIARMADGSWKVLSSRCDAPSGIGYALENRIVVGQTFPDLFGDMQIQRLASFFNTWRECVLSLAHSRRGRAVLLTPGPHNETYFEHAYLAHYLGLTLVEGDDLVVRDDQVFLRSLVGLERVAVIFRRIDSDFCDPLELRSDSALGIPGLVDAVRSGAVVLANALGGGVMESPAMDAYLPALAKHVLGEELKIPDTPTVWCGTEWGRTEALARLDRVIVRDAFDSRPLFSRQSSARVGSELTSAEIAALRTRLARRGATVVTQDVVPLGLAPTFNGERFSTQPVSLRVFAAWTPHGYAVMPGGLVRTSPDTQTRSLSMQSGASSKDAWVVGRGPADTFTLLKQTGRTVEIRRVGEAPPSRAMDNLFWLGRYSERAETLVRILRALVLRINDEPQAVADLRERFLQHYLRPTAVASGDDNRQLHELRGLLYDQRSLDGLQRLLSRVRQTAWSARDRLSLDTWRTIQKFTERSDAKKAEQLFDPAEASHYLDSLIRSAAAFSGLSAEDMTRGPNWLFVDLGRRIERGSQLAWIVRQTAISADPLEISRMRVALEIADSAMTYRSRYLNMFQIAPLIDLLLLDDSNPRGVAFQLAAIERNLEELPRITAGQRREGPFNLAADIRRAASHADALLLAHANDADQRLDLATYVDTIDNAMSRITDAITDAYFRHAVHRRTGAARREAT
jgi:uncharacterized circularly permuted ATP-grasp superfamily protein/uncharacterized alpha-E superfamily protein